MGRLALSLFYAVLPWAFHYVERVAASPRRMRAALLGGSERSPAQLHPPRLRHLRRGAAGMLQPGAPVVLPEARPDAGAILRRRTSAFPPRRRLRVLHERRDVSRARLIPGCTSSASTCPECPRPHLAAPAGLVQLPLLAASSLNPITGTAATWGSRWFAGPGRRRGGLVAAKGEARPVLGLSRSWWRWSSSPTAGLLSPTCPWSMPSTPRATCSSSRSSSPWPRAWAPTLYCPVVPVGWRAAAGTPSCSWF